MKKTDVKDIIVGGIVNLIFLTLACVFARIFSNMSVKLVDLFVKLEFISASGVRAVTLFLGSAFFALLFSRMYGYHTLAFDKTETPLSALAGALMHFVLSFVTVFSPWVAGATKHVGGFIAFGERYTKSDYMKLIPMPTLILVGLVTALIYAGLLVLGTYVGTKKRIYDRAELLGENPA